VRVVLEGLPEEQLGTGFFHHVEIVLPSGRTLQVHAQAVPGEERHGLAEADLDGDPVWVEGE
jgi:hypothetical protein